MRDRQLQGHGPGADAGGTGTAHILDEEVRELIVGIITPGVGALRVMMPVPPLVSIPAPSTPVMLIDVLMVTGL
jgi:hypothetical protein